jgi:hypothetical protein
MALMASANDKIIGASIYAYFGLVSLVKTNGTSVIITVINYAILGSYRATDEWDTRKLSINKYVWIIVLYTFLLMIMALFGRYLMSLGGSQGIP